MGITRTTSAAAVTRLTAAVAVAVVNPPDRPSGQGRVVDGQGYTRVRPRESEPVHDAKRRLDRELERGGGVGSLVVIGGSSGGGSVSSLGLLEWRRQ